MRIERFQTMPLPARPNFPGNTNRLSFGSIQNHGPGGITKRAQEETPTKKNSFSKGKLLAYSMLSAAAGLGFHQTANNSAKAVPSQSQVSTAHSAKTSGQHDEGKPVTLDQLRQDIHQSKEILEKSREEIKRLQELLNKQSQDVITLKSALDVHHISIDAMKESVEKLDKELQQKSKLYEELAQTTQKTNEATEKKLDKTLSEIKDLSGEMDTRLKQLNRAMVSFRSDITKSLMPLAVQITLPNGNSGSGVIFKTDNGENVIVTNAHILDYSFSDKPNEDAIYTISLYTGSDWVAPKTFTTKVKKMSDGTQMYTSGSQGDLAILEIPKDAPIPENIKPVPLRDIKAHPLQVGEPLISLGSPNGLRDSASFGHVSMLSRYLSGKPNNVWLQHDAPYGIGASGGPLFAVRFEEDGSATGKLIPELVSVNSLDQTNYDGIAFSVHPSVMWKHMTQWGLVGQSGTTAVADKPAK